MAVLLCIQRPNVFSNGIVIEIVQLRWYRIFASLCLNGTLATIFYEALQ
jgi:hypothetical protein